MENWDHTTIVQVKDSLGPQYPSGAGKSPQVADAWNHAAQLHINHLNDKGNINLARNPGPTAEGSVRTAAQRGIED